MSLLHVRLYTRPGCHLCEEAAQMMETLRDEFDFELREVNIDEDPALKESLRERIPVITINGGSRISMHITEEKLRRAFRNALRSQSNGE